MQISLRPPARTHARDAVTRGTGTASLTFGEFSASSAFTFTQSPLMPFMAFSPGIGLSFGHGDAV